MVFLKKSKTINNILNEISSEISLRKTEFYNVKLDYFVITLYGEFEKDLDSIIEKKLNCKNNFSKNYINYIKTNDCKLHRGFKGTKFKELIKKVFGIEILEVVSNTNWEIFLAFIEFRHAIAHSLKSYKQKKEALSLKIKDTNNLIIAADEILTGLDKNYHTRATY